MVLNRLYSHGGEVHKSIVDKLTKRKKREIQRNQFRPIEIWEYYAEESKLGARVKDGEFSLEMMRELLDKLFRSEDQKTFHEVFQSTALRLIFGPDFNKHKYMIKKKFNFERLIQQCIVTCPRRHGKTHATAHFVAVAALCVFVYNMMSGGETKRGCKIAVFSPSKRQSIALIANIVSIIDNLGYNDRLISRSKEKLQILNFNGDTSEITAYPAVVRTVRGAGGDILVCDEIAFIPEEFIKEVVLPLFSVDHTCLIGISTILGDENLMSKYIEMKDNNGQDLFNTIRVFTACKSCRDADKAHSCTHKTSIPNWQSVRKHKIIKAMYQEDEQTFLQEIGGIGHNLNETCFKKKFIDGFINRKPFLLDPSHQIDHIFISVDPSGCGTTSDVALTSMIRYCGGYQIIGAENYNAKTLPELKGLVIDHVRALNNLPQYRLALKVFILENNMCAACQVMVEAIENNINRFLILNTVKEGTSSTSRATIAVGLRTTHEVKAVGTELLNNIMKDGSLMIINESAFVSVSLQYNLFKTTLKRQMEDFCRIVIDDPLEKGKVKFSGKVKGTKKDDLLVAVMLVCYWNNMFFREPRYERFM